MKPGTAIVLTVLLTAYSLAMFCFGYFVGKI